MITRGLITFVAIFTVMFGAATIFTGNPQNKRVYGMVFAVLMALLVIAHVGPVDVLY